MAYSPLTSGETDADSPVDQTLWTKVKDNFDFLKTKSEGQTVNTQDGEVNTGTTQMPSDDSIPQNTEGDEYMTLSITPNSATSKLKIEVVGYLQESIGGNTKLTLALFQDSIANALACVFSFNGTTNSEPPITFTHFMTSGTTSATTFKVRAGANNAGTTTFNGSSGARKYGGVLASSVTITEIP